MLATSPPNTNIFHPFPHHLRHAKLRSLPAAPQRPRRTDGPTALHITAKFPSEGAFASKWLSTGCDLQFSLQRLCGRSTLSPWQKQENNCRIKFPGTIRKKMRKNPNPKCKGTFQSQQILELFDAFESICSSPWLRCVSFHWAHTMQDKELTRVFV